jgi:hypothetical protein
MHPDVKKRLIIASITAGLAVAAAMIFLAPAKDYDIRVHASTSEEGAGRRTGGVMTATRVSIENVGLKPITNASVTYTGVPFEGGKERIIGSDFVPVIEPGSKANLSPNLEGYATFVSVTADNGIDVKSGFSRR